MFAEVAGWLRLNEERLPKALEIIKADLDGLGYYGASWCVQTQGGGYSRHLCFGCSVRESEVEQVRAQVARIASEAFSADGDCVDYPVGLFRVEYESEGAPVVVWQISGGTLRVANSE